MIPSKTGFLEKDFEIKEQPSFTHRMDLKFETVRGYTDEKEAMRQAIYKILLTERYQYVMYSWNYGLETMDLYGMPIAYVVPELERRIRDALLYDTRIMAVTDFEFTYPAKRVVHVSFIAHTIFGEVQAERGVNY